LNRQRLHQRHRVGVAEVEPPPPLGHHDGEPAVGREIQVVRIVHRDVRAFLTGGGIDGRERAAQVVCYPERREVVRGHHVLRQRARGKRAQYDVAARVDDGHRPVLRVRHVDQRARLRRPRRQPVRGGGCVQVHGVAPRRRVGGRDVPPPGRRRATCPPARGRQRQRRGGGQSRRPPTRTL